MLARLKKFFWARLRTAKVVIALLLTCSIPFILPISESHAETPASFDDANLEAAVRGALSIPEGQPVTDTDMLRLTFLNAPERGIVSLKGLEYATNLTYLFLSGNQISNAGPLGSLTKLTWLSLEGNQISDAGPLGSLTNLTGLSLGRNQITDFSPLGTLTNLTVLSVESMQITDISPLGSLTNLTYLFLANNRISNISALGSLTNLTSLYLDNNQITDVNPLGSLTKLTYLDLAGNQVGDISALGSLTNLTGLMLMGNQVTDVSPLRPLTKLTYLILASNWISDISTLGTLTNLTTLRVDDNQITDISPLGSLTNLISLHITKNRVTDISPLGSLTNLTELWANKNPIYDISPLGSLTRLTFLRIGYNWITDIGALVLNSDNGGLGSGDIVYVDLNYLDLTPGSQNMTDINTLKSRGVVVIYTPQKTPPRTTISPNPAIPDGTDGWYTTVPVISLSTSGSDSIYYQWDSENGPWTRYQGSLTAPGGVHTLHFYSNNTDGFSESHQGKAFKVDPNKPAIAITTPLNGSVVGDPAIMYRAPQSILAPLALTASRFQSMVAPGSRQPAPTSGTFLYRCRLKGFTLSKRGRSTWRAIPGSRARCRSPDGRSTARLSYRLQIQP